MSALKDRIMADTGGKPGRALIIVPNERPWQYFRHLFAEDRKAAVLPQMITGMAATSLWRRHACGPAANAALLDQVYWLRQCVMTLGCSNSLLDRMFGKMEMAQFLPWGIRLAQLLNEIFQQHIDAPNIAASEGDVHRYAGALLESLREISQSFRDALLREHLTTAGFDSWLACEHLDNVPPELNPGNRPIYIAGFAVLNGGEKRLFRNLWERGAQICFQGDAALAEGGAYDPACRPIAELMEKWGSGGVLACADKPGAPAYEFFSAYDGHSQLEQLALDRRLVKEGTEAIVLLDPGLLSPALHHLPDKNVNISMGFPLARAPMCGLLRAVFQLALNSLPDGRYYWRDLDTLFHNPLAGMLKCGAEGNFRQQALPVIHRMLRGEEEEAEPGKYVEPEEFLEIARGKMPAQAYVILRLGLVFLNQLAKAETPAELAGLLSSFCAYIGRKSLLVAKDGTEEDSRQFPLDTEALCRLQDNVFPALGRNALADEKFSLAALRDMLHILIEQERIPFRAFPLLGTQVLGMLETRLLQFDHVYILDASDDLLPGHKAQDPLLPDSLRGLIGLPQRFTRQQAAAYNLARLCACADTVHFYWPQGQTPGSLDQGKKNRSRFVEQLLWKREEAERRLIEAGQKPLLAAVSRASIHKGFPRAIPCLAPMREKLQKLLSGNISASMLNVWLRCPAQFVYKYLLNLKTSQDVNEGEDPLIIGDCVHAILRDLFEPLLDKDIPAEEADRMEYFSACFPQIFKKQTEDFKLESRLPVFSWLYFEKAAPRHIGSYFMTQPRNSRPLFLEREVQARVDLDGRDYAFRGRIDRIDQREGGFMILDYKTGAPGMAERSIWAEEDFFNLLSECSSAEDFATSGENLLDKFRKSIPDLQLPIYLLMAAQTLDKPAANAAYVWLRNAGNKRESRLWPEEMDVGIGLKRCGAAVSFVIRAMLHSPVFRPSPDKCGYCGYMDACWTEEHAGLDQAGKI